MTSQIAPHIWVPEPELAFHVDRSSDRDIHPLRGLQRFGPYSAGLVPDPIRVATLSPAGESSKLHTFLKSLNSAHTPRERRDYLPEWPGFKPVFGIQMTAAEGKCHIELDPALEAEFSGSPNPHVVLTDRLVRAIQRLQAIRPLFDVLFIYLPKRWAPGYTGGLEEDFDLHDHLKAASAALGLPIQLVREDSALAYYCQASVIVAFGCSCVREGRRNPMEVGRGRSRNSIYRYFLRVATYGVRWVTLCHVL